MFDTIGRHDDDEAPKRRFQALLLGSLLVGGAGAFALGWIGYRVVEEATTPEPPPPPYVMLETPPEVVPLPDLPPLPKGRPGPVGAAGPGGDDRPAPSAPPEAVVPDPRVERLPEPRPIANHQGTPGEKSLTPGTPGGTGDCPDCGGGGGGGGELHVHSSELQPRRRVLPRYPAEALGRDLGEQLCGVRLRVDEKGYSTVLGVEGCDPVFHATAIEALGRWRWYPKRVGGTKIPARTVVQVRFMP